MDKIKTSEKVLAFRRVKESFKDIRDDIIEIKTLSAVDEYKDEDALVLASGDPMFYGITEYIKKLGILGEVYTGISSIQYMAAKIKMSWHDMDLVSVHGREYDLSKIHKSTIFLTDNIMTPNKISEELFKLGFEGEVIAGYNLSYDDELITRFKIGESSEAPTSLAVCVVIIWDVLMTTNL